MDHSDGDAAGLEGPVDALGEIRDRPVQRLLELWTPAAHLTQDGSSGSEGQRMLAERTGEERPDGVGVGGVAEQPGAAVDGIEVPFAAGDHSDGKTATDDLPVGGDVRVDPEQGLCAAGVHPEAGDDLVEDESHLGGSGQFPELAQEGDGLQVRMRLWTGSTTTAASSCRCSSTTRSESSSP